MSAPGDRARGDGAPAVRSRLVVLGASNVVSGLDKIVAAARAATGGPLDVHVAMGHGRSYGLESSFWGVRRAAIRECGLLEAVAAAPAAPTAALVTDIGPDLLYGAQPQQVVTWVMDCVDALRAAGASPLVTQLPVHCLDTLGAARYRLFRAMFFPRCRLTLQELGGRALAANSEIIFAARQRGVTSVPLAPHWYGIDPIHIATRRSPEAWGALVSGCFAASSHPSAGGERSGSLARDAAQNAAEFRGFWRFRALRGKRCALADGTTITLY